MLRKILFLTSRLPYPPISGGVIKSWKIVEFLSQNYELSIACFLKKDDKYHMDEFLNNLHLNHFYSEPLDVPRTALNLLRSYFLKMSLNLYRSYSNSFKEHIENISNNYDILFVDHFSMFQYAPGRFRGKVILHQHNAEYVMWKRLAKIEKNFIKKMMIYLESFRIENYEKNICNQASKVLCVSSNDIENLKTLGIPREKFRLAINAGDEHLLSLPNLQFDETEKALLYVGTLSWEANADGLMWFIANSWERLKKRNPDLKFYIIGKNPDTRLRNLVKSKRGIILLGFVKDLEEYYSTSRVFVAPLRFGGGIKIKVINAMYRGIPTVTTLLGIEGIEAEDMTHVGIADNAQGIEKRIHALLNDREVWEKLRDNSRKLSSEKYNWKSVFSNVKKVIDE